ncbi:thioredoxin-related protein [Roseibacterium elongatum DSM 19469]|uniref:Thioredoxin-related protein n=1 Tax=Roseicyclus elongatus DSM 19469 TaxID=1294273 RepID=W8RQ62_9RHOB|nr:thioredoxin family protein [Roseibacterium elongatum]AHM03309.1 thioredoxin-related protein [Roseibacterium elongatum DSM 19469]
MTRRELFLGASALALTPTLALGQVAPMIEYEAGLPERLLAEGHTVFLDFAASWCGTCRAQGRIIEDLRAANPAYDDAMTFVRVDWDRYGQSEFALMLGVPRRSTLIVLRGEDELGRVIASTRDADIRALMETALAEA